MPKASDNCATVQRLDAHLRRRVPELCRLHPEKPVQTPATSVEPGQKWYLLLLPDVATEPDIAMLKNQAYQTATLDENLELAEQLWIRIIAATNGQDREALRAYAKIMNREKPPLPTPPLSQTPFAAKPSSSRSTDSQPSPPPVRLPSLSEEVHDTNPLPSIGIQPAQPENLLPKKVIPWIPLILLGFLYTSSTVGVQLTQPENLLPKKVIPWIPLVLLGFLYDMYGIILVANFTPLGVGTLAFVAAFTAAFAAAFTAAFVEVGAWAGALAFAAAFIGTFAGTWAWAATGAWAWAATGALVVFFAWFGAGGKAGKKLLISFSRFHTFLILTGTSCLGLGLGVSLTWVVTKAVGS